MKPFPVLKLNTSITDVFKKITSIEFKEGINTGLNPKIKIIEENGPMQNIAEYSTHDIKVDGYINDVKVSAAFSQVLWMICSIAYRHYESIAINSELENEIDKKGTTREQYIQNLQKSQEEEALYQLKLINEKDVFQNSCKLLNIIEKISKKTLEENEMDDLYKLEMDDCVGSRINGLYVYAMAFILLHEYTHHILKTPNPLEDEINADSHAFWTLFSDLEGKEKNTAQLGILCALVSIIFFNPTLKDDTNHPRPVSRIFDYYDIVKEEGPKCAGLMCNLFWAWAVYTRDNDMPSLPTVKELPNTTNPYETTIENIRKYMIQKEALAYSQSTIS